MKRTIVAILFISFFCGGYVAAQENAESTSFSITDASDPFVRELEQIELDAIGEGKHWRKGDFEPFRFLQCDVAGSQARLAYVRDLNPNQVAFFLVYFDNIDGKWHFSFNDMTFLPKTQSDGSATTLKDALKTKNEMYWLTSDY